MTYRRSLWALALLALPAVAVDLGSEAQREAGRQLYDKYCSQCHGEQGDGKGVAAPRLKPSPRDFTSGKYKIRTTPSGALPTDDDMKKAIRDGLPYTSMPAWPNFTDDETQSLVDYLKTFAEAFADPSRSVSPIDIPEPPASTEESVKRGSQVYEELGCAKCHGEVGRADGLSAPTLVDDWGQHIRPADMTMRWTFRGGPTERDIFRTFSTGMNGTPMPSYADALGVEDRWHLVHYIRSLGAGDAPNYSNLLVVDYVEDELDLGRAAELFAGAVPARFPLVGQITEPGRNFAPSTTSLVVRAVYNRRELALELRWHDMRAERSGRSGPDLEVPLAEEERIGPAPAAPAAASEDDFWGGSGGEAEAAGQAEPEKDFWGDEQAEAEGQAPSVADSEFADAVAVQLPATLPDGARKPYFIFGDAELPVDLWFVDLSAGRLQTYTGRGSASVVPASGDEIEVQSGFDRGEWTVVLKRSLRATSGISFQEGQFAPIAFSVWDGFNRERGNKRALSVWYHLYLQPSQQISAVGPMIRAGLGTLGAELLIVFLVRRWQRQRRAPGRTQAAVAAEQVSP